MARPEEDREARFWRFVSPEPNTGCWVWLGALDGGGYPIFSIRTRNIGAHRYALIRESGGNRPGLQACHRCDNRWCVNPDHLFWGTALDNKMDCVAKGRQAKGARNSRSKLNHPAVHEIRRLRAEGMTQRAIAARFGVAQRTVVQVLEGLTWRDA